MAVARIAVAAVRSCVDHHTSKQRVDNCQVLRGNSSKGLIFQNLKASQNRGLIGGVLQGTVDT